MHISELSQVGFIASKGDALDDEHRSLRTHGAGITLLICCPGLSICFSFRPTALTSEFGSSRTKQNRSFVLDAMT
jgi:hypothetical protein